MNAIRHLLRDIQRALLLVWNLLRFFTLPWLVRARTPVGVRLRRFCEAMGITYLKLGQFMAMRFDILPPDVCKELQQLFDDVEPLPFAPIRARIEQELGRPLEELYASFETKPLAAASVAQVHRARTHTGDDVAVKVQRPGIEATFRADVRNIRRAAALADRFRVLGRTSVVAMVDEFAAFTLREMNFVTEGRTADRLRHNAAPFEIIPKVYWDLTSRRVLTLEFVDGISVSKATSLIEQGRTDVLDEYYGGPDGIDEATSNFARASMRQLFVTGFYHGDPHPGNILFRRDRRVVFLDFGIFGMMTGEELETMASFIENVALGNIDKAMLYYERFSAPSPDTDIGAFRRETKAILARWHEASKDPSSPIEDRHVGMVFGKILDVYRRHHVKLGADQLLFFRAMLALDATALRVAHRFDLLREMQTFFEDIRPGLNARVREMLRDPKRNVYLADLTRRLPDATSALRDMARSGARPLPVRTEGERAQRRDTLAVDVVGFAVVGTALAIAAASVSIAAPARVLLWCAGVALLVGVMFAWRPRWPRRR